MLFVSELLKNMQFNVSYTNTNPFFIDVVSPSSFSISTLCRLSVNESSPSSHSSSFSTHVIHFVLVKFFLTFIPISDLILFFGRFHFTFMLKMFCGNISSFMVSKICLYYLILLHIKLSSNRFLCKFSLKANSLVSLNHKTRTLF